jgi:hypothetical protein
VQRGTARIRREGGIRVYRLLAGPADSGESLGIDLLATIPVGSDDRFR